MKKAEKEKKQTKSRENGYLSKKQLTKLQIKYKGENK
tara:strand:+ start:667 stop:777 length:111 start_codon:yes stop_codon:yes gene_type:complete